ncbi:MAG: 4'-phosphopantetheinyl transferase superfamily protein [Oscillospiraceae bacterium]|jgi:4'-phosphopantetheinyl transferase|nr:4'-phosphopantetheinyl transferase superfamily protein [Oscillospiraceae bacterium]
MAEIYLLPLAAPLPEASYRALLPRVSAARRKRIEAFRFEADRARCLLGAVLVRHLAGRAGLPRGEALTFTCNRYGKPYFTDRRRYFNLSHSGDWIVCGWSGREIGVDVQHMAPTAPDVDRLVFHETERAALRAARDDEARRALFYDYWTLKEAYVKYLGTGLSTPLRSLCFHLSPGGGVRCEGLGGTPRFFRRDVDPVHKLAVCTEDDGVALCPLTVEQLSDDG